jgi:hypothetical protein
MTQVAGGARSNDGRQPPAAPTHRRPRPTGGPDPPAAFPTRMRYVGPRHVGTSHVMRSTTCVNR